ncbi:MAG: hypothetical protein AAF829_11105 [Pseudomonadota bacterium]
MPTANAIETVWKPVRYVCGAINKSYQNMGSAAFRIAFLMVLLAVCGVALSWLQPWIDPRWLYMDSKAVGELRGSCCNVYDGAISNLGLMLWAGTAAIALFVATMSAARGRNYLVEGSAFFLSTVLLLDDAFMLHEHVFPRIGIPQTLVIVGLGTLTLAYLSLAFKRLIGCRQRWLLVLSLMMFATSVLVDQILHTNSTIIIVLEDGPKFIGIVCWFLFHLNLFLEEMNDWIDQVAA